MKAAEVTSSRALRRIVLVIAAAMAAAPAHAGAAGATYTAAQCGKANRGAQDAKLSDSHSYFARNACGVSGEHAVEVNSTGRARHGASGSARWSTGTSSLAIVGVEVSAKLRRHRGHSARLWMADAERRETARVGTGRTDQVTYRHYRWHTEGRGQRQLIASLSCEKRSGCPRSDQAHTWLRSLRLTVADYSQPALTTGGTLIAGGWRRGAQDLATAGSDTGSGLQRLSATVDGTGFLARSPSCAAIPGSPYAKTFEPCPASLSTSSITVNTAAPPFHDGRDLVSICAADFAGNRSCQTRSVAIDNTPPKLAFANAQNPNDPELIRAPVYDATSGVAGGHIYYRADGSAAWRPLITRVASGALETRVNSTAVPPGRYEFVAQAFDVAGNSTWTTLRQNGQPMVLTFPLKSGVRLSGYLGKGGSHRKTIAYHRRSTVRGRLTNRQGRPIAGQPVTVTEHFGSGALISQRVRTVTTDSRGRWHERIPAGPSRQISATYAGSRRYIGQKARVGSLAVRTKVGLRLSRNRIREGKRVLFKGRVRHLAARIPSDGKLVELQVKSGHQWTTVRHAFHTNDNGKYRFRYRFGRFYTSNVHYRFRVMAPHEQGWPYKAPAKSKTRKLVVKAR